LEIFSFTEFVKKTYEGFTGMTDIFFIVDAYRRFSCDGGKTGGINYLLYQIKDVLKIKSAQAE
jgi:hypothetical protein